MIGSFQLCLWLIPDDIPRERLQPLAGRNFRIGWTWGGDRTPSERPPVGSRGTIPHAQEYKGQRFNRSPVVALAFIFHILATYYTFFSVASRAFCNCVLTYTFFVVIYEI